MTPKYLLIDARYGNRVPCDSPSTVRTAMKVLGDGYDWTLTITDDAGQTITLTGTDLLAWAQHDDRER